MKTRVIVGAALLVMLVALLYFGGVVYLGVLTLFSLSAVHEITLAFTKKGYRPISAPAYVFAAVYAWAYYFFGAEALLCCYLAAVLATASLSLLLRERTVTDAIVSLFTFIYPLLFTTAALFVYFSFTRAVGLTAACMALAAPEMSDMSAYFTGTWFGKHKLCPAISPKKTVEGSVGALAGGVLFGAVVALLQPLWGGPVPVWALLLLGLLCGVFSQLGDLFASTIKRWAEMKDFSSVFPGHGGILDRVDSILFCTPLTLIVFIILTKAGLF